METAWVYKHPLEPGVDDKLSRGDEEVVEKEGSSTAPCNEAGEDLKPSERSTSSLNNQNCADEEATQSVRKQFRQKKDLQADCEAADDTAHHNHHRFSLSFRRKQKQELQQQSNRELSESSSYNEMNSKSENSRHSVFGFRRTHGHSRRRKSHPSGYYTEGKHNTSNSHQVSPESALNLHDPNFPLDTNFRRKSHPHYDSQLLQTHSASHSNRVAFVDLPNDKSDVSSTHEKETTNHSSSKKNTDHSMNSAISDNTTTSHRPSLAIIHKVQKKGSKVVRSVSKVWSNVLLSVESLIFPPPQSPLFDCAQTTKVANVRGGVLLDSCSNEEEHKAKIKDVVEKARHLHGEKGLYVVGFEYRLVLCDEHKHKNENSDAVQHAHSDLESKEGSVDSIEKQENAEFAPMSLEKEDDSLSGIQQADVAVTESSDAIKPLDEETASNNEEGKETNNKSSPVTPTGSNTKRDNQFCHSCATRLFHISSNTMIDSDNRKRFIADGDMYDHIARLCQENAHEVMERDYGLVWVTIYHEQQQEEGVKKINHHTPEGPARALVNSYHPLAVAQQHEEHGTGTSIALRRRKNDDDSINLGKFVRRPTLLIATGRGKVRAGIFSRQHLLISGMESSTAIPLVREANIRELNIVVLDPNLYGDHFGMITFERSMAGIFKPWEPPHDETKSTPPLESRDLYILSHSASGAQLARFLSDRSEHVPHIRAIAFTDSTHNIQWVKQNECHDLCKLLESPACVYFRCSDENRDGSEWHLHRTGEEVETDSFWEHRFGKIKTLWAGTSEHSLTNWYAHSHIWEHFDKYLSMSNSHSNNLESLKEEDE